MGFCVQLIAQIGLLSPAKYSANNNNYLCNICAAHFTFSMGHAASTLAMGQAFSAHTRAHSNTLTHTRMGALDTEFTYVAYLLLQQFWQVSLTGKLTLYIRVCVCIYILCVCVDYVCVYTLALAAAKNNFSRILHTLTRTHTHTETRTRTLATFNARGGSAIRWPQKQQQQELRTVRGPS